MKRLAVQTLPTIFATLLLASFSHAADSPTKEQEALMQRECDWAQAWKMKDAKTVASLEADEYAYTNFDGVVTDKAADLADLKSSTFTVSWDVDNTKAMIFGDAGVVMGHQTQKRNQDGRNLSGVFRFTDTRIKRDGRWQCVASQITRIEKP
jgi:hypothetical protein